MRWANQSINRIFDVCVCVDQGAREQRVDDQHPEEPAGRSTETYKTRQKTPQEYNKILFTESI